MEQSMSDTNILRYLGIIPFLKGQRLLLRIKNVSLFSIFAYIPFPTFSKKITEKHVSVNLRDKFSPKLRMPFRLDNGKTTTYWMLDTFFIFLSPLRVCNICYNPGYDTCQGESMCGGGGGGSRQNKQSPPQILQYI
jgi:hypothetical protein